MTGASSGIGLASVQALLATNASVLGVDISPAPIALQSLNSSLFRFHQCNLAESSAPAKVVQACHDAFGPRIDILQNVAGIMDTWNSADTVSDEIWDRMLAVNLTAPLKLMRAVLQVMKGQSGGGAIVNVSSAAGLCGYQAGVAYTASKFGLVSIFL